MAFVPRQRWGFMDIIFVYIGMFIISILFGFFGGNFISLFAQWGIPNTELGFFITGFVVQFLATIILVFIFTLGKYDARLSDLGIRRAKKSDYTRYGLLGGLILMVLVIIMGYFINYLQPELQPQLYEEMLRSVKGLPGFVTLFIIGAVMAPISEELFYRGMIYPVIRRHVGPLWGAILAGTIFGLAHWDFWRTIPLAVGGAILCYIYEKSGSIFVSTVTHGVWNGIMSIFVYLSIVNSI